jgi:hypothetical protein
LLLARQLLLLIQLLQYHLVLRPFLKYPVVQLSLLAQLTLEYRLRQWRLQMLQCPAILVVLELLAVP